MKKAEKINIKGSIFHIDDDAYKLLKSYLESIKECFSGKEGDTEIIDDIESRIVEIFQSEISKHKKEVITINDVKKAIDTLGKPEDFKDIEDDSKQTSSKESRTRHLYRDVENSIIAGISSGIGHYMAMDPAWIRAAFLLLILFNGLGLILYLILWIVIPPAKTTSQRIEMKGEKVNIENIEKAIRNEFENVKENFQRIKDSDGFNRTKDGITRFFEIIGKLIVAFVKFIVLLIGISFIIIGFLMLFGLIGLFVYKEWAFF